MDRQYFIDKVMRLESYDQAINTIDEAFDGGSISEGFLGNILSDIADLLITGVNPNLEGLAEDYFYETFWDYVSEQADKEAWGEYYDLLKEGKADPDYIERWS